MAKAWQAPADSTATAWAWHAWAQRVATAWQKHGKRRCLDAPRQLLTTAAFSGAPLPLPGAMAAAATLAATAFNVGMPSENAFKATQALKIQQLTNWVIQWMQGPGGAVVGLQEVHPDIAGKLLASLRSRVPDMKIESAVQSTNCALWRAPQFWLPCLPLACPASCWCLDAPRAAGRTCTAQHATRAQRTHAHMHIT